MKYNIGQKYWYPKRSFCDCRDTFALVEVTAFLAKGDPKIRVLNVGPDCSCNFKLAVGREFYTCSTLKPYRITLR